MICKKKPNTIRLWFAASFLAIAAGSGCTDLLVQAPEGTNSRADFEAAWSRVNDVYPFFQLKHIDWDSIHALYKQRVDKAQGDESLTVLFDLLSELRDGHVSITFKSGKEFSTYRVPRSVRDQSLYDPLAVRKHSIQELIVSSDRKMEYGSLADNIGYIRLTTFVQGQWASEFASALEYLRNTSGLIIDIRHNGGGSTTVADVVIGRFIETPLAYPPHYSRGQLQPTRYAQPSGSFHYARSVVVLINGVCFSTAEYFAEMMKQVPTVTVVGDTTGGGGGIPQPFSLPSGIQIKIPVGEYRQHDGVPIEWNGVPPDITILNTEEEVKQGRDNQLEYAIQLLRQ
jgi:hypothetical protein